MVEQNGININENTTPVSGSVQPETGVETASQEATIETKEVDSFVTRVINAFDAKGGGWVGVATFLVFAAWIANYILPSLGIIKYTDLQAPFTDMMHAYEVILLAFVGTSAHKTINNTILKVKGVQ